MVKAFFADASGCELLVKAFFADASGYELLVKAFLANASGYDFSEGPLRWAILLPFS